MSITPLTVTIDLNPSYKRIPAVYVSQLDNNLRELAITVQDGGVNYDVASSGYDVYVEGTKPDKHGFSYKVTDIGGTVVGSVVTVPMQTQMTCVQGMVPTEIVLKSGADRIGSANFLLVVERAGLDEDTDVSETDIPGYISGAQTAAANAQTYELQSEGYARGSQGGVDVTSGSTYYENNSKYFYNQAATVAASIPADYTTLSNDVDDLKSAIDEYLEYKNIVNADFTVTGYVQSNGVFATTQGFKSTELIPIVSDKTTVEGTLQCVKKNISYITYYDSSQSVIQVVVGSNSSETVEESFYQKVPLGTAYVRFSARQAYVSGTTISIKICSIVNELLFDMDTITYYVGYGKNDGVHYFTSLVDCLNVAKNYPDTYKIININRGTYDVLSELGGMDYIMSHTTAESYADVQPMVSNVKIIGHGTVVLTFNIADGTPNTNYWLFSCLNVRGNVEIENIEIQSSNCRYCIHDESSNNFKDTVHRYKNVRLYQNFYHVGAGGQALGTGYSENSRVYIEDCVFVNGGGNSSGETYSCHAYNGTVFTIDNCVFKRTGTALGGIRISQNGVAKLHAIISNSFVSNKILIRNEWTDATIVGQTKMYLVNTNSTVENGYTTVTETVTKYDSINNTETELVSVS